VQRPRLEVTGTATLTLRLSDADRSRAAVQLRDACVDGKLTVEELSQRLESAYSARTIAELAPVLDDLAPSPAESRQLAPWWSRAAALLVDGCILTGTALLAGLPFAAVGRPQWLVTGVLVALPLSLAYFTVAHGGPRGQTVGDYVNDIAVKSDALRTGIGGRASYGQAFGRTLMVGLFLGLFLVGGFLDFFWPLWDRRRQAWHDKVAGTIVVRTAPRLQSPAEPM
jgi:uncharacterized RDD family membrane protein YckC